MSVLCSLRGAITPTDIEKLTVRLKSLCGQGADVDYHERAYIQPKATRTGATVNLRTQHHYKSNEFQLNLLGPVRVGDDDIKYDASVQTIIETKTGENVAEFMDALGLQFSHEFRRTGVKYMYGDVETSVTRVYKVGTGNTTSSEELIDENFIVEVSSVGTREKVKEVRHFADQLQPLVTFQL
eukprot:m.33030 g.33030  ORF g.33030 m.33030 type:complete len:183 (-) comp8479_c0_seq2:137-685(-)